MTKLRKIVALIASVSMMIGVMPQVAMAATFSDVPDTNEFAVYINDLYAQGVVGGVGSTGMYMPLRNVSRGEMMKMVMNSLRVCGAGMPNLEAMLNVPLLPGAPHFEDVPVGSSFYEFVEQAYAMGIVQGRRAPAEGQQGLFGVDASVLRQEAMKMAINGCRKIKPDVFRMDLTGGPSFDDVSASSEFYDYIQTGYNLGIVNGYGNSKFGPMDPMRRDQMAKVVSNMLKVCRDGKPLSVGVPAQILVESSDPKIKNDGHSTSTITCTVVDRNGNRVGDWTDPFVFTTDMGDLRVIGSTEPAASTKSVASDKGRGQISLISSTTEGMATVSCKTKDFTGSTKVEFTSAAPGSRNGFGSSQLSGVGELSLRITDDHIVASAEARPVGASFAPGNTHTVDPVNGFATLEAFMYDDEGDPTCGDTMIFSIKEGNGHLSTANLGFPMPGPFTGTPVRAVTTSTCMNGRFVAYLYILDDQNSGDVVIQVLNRSVSPSLITEATVRIDLVTLEAKVYDNDILTRNSAQITAVTATSQNVAPVLIRTLDENNEPFLTVDPGLSSNLNNVGEHDIECRFISGATADALLEGVDGTPSAGPEYADYVEGSPGLYAINVIAGSADGDLTIECRDRDAVGQAKVQVSVNVHSPEVELFVSSREVQDGTVSTVMARVLDNNKAVTGEELRLQMEGGDGMLDEYDGGAYTFASASSNFVRMDHICYNNDPTDFTVVGNIKRSSGGAFADVGIATFGTTCTAAFGANFVDSGWYTAKLYIPAGTERDQTQAMRVTDVSRADQPQDQIDVVATTDNPSDLDQLELHPLVQELGVNQEFATVIFAQDQDGQGLACDPTSIPASINGGGDAGENASGCHLDRNGYAVVTADSISMNTTTVAAATSGALVVNPTTSENLFLYSRGLGTDGTNDWMLHNLGGGAYFFVAQAKDRADRAEFDVEAYDSSGTPASSELVQANITPNTVEAEFNQEDVMPDWMNTFIVYVSDWNDDPVVGLSGCRRPAAAFPTNNFSDFVITRSGSEVDDVDSTDDDFAAATPAFGCDPPDGGPTFDDPTDLLNNPGAVPGLVGTGLYLWNVDIDNEAQAGEVKLKVSTNQATNPEDEASFRIVDATVDFDAWPNHVTSSNVIPLTVIVRDDDGDPVTFDFNGFPTSDDNVRVEIIDGSGNLDPSNVASPSSGASVMLLDTIDGVFVSSYRASSVSESVELEATVDALNSRTTDSLTVVVD